jgi:tRNA (adenine57-N1/adenine58-N1)-methyltransferase catalytic subunit
MTHFRSSSFIDPGHSTREGSLAILHLKRDHLVPVLLRANDEDDTVFSQNNIINTRYGSYPHNSLLNVPWGSQIVATKVDTGSRGRKGGKKRKRDDDSAQAAPSQPAKGSSESATSGFAHLLPPTAETWTASLPHRTQVVYTPDYSYIIQRLRIRPGDTVIEAGAGSGSFTHAAARAVFNGYPARIEQPCHSKTPAEVRKGHIYSYEFHQQRAEQMQKDVIDHGLTGVVTVTHRDIYKDGFCLPQDGGNNTASKSPEADAIFLDVPAPWYVNLILLSSDNTHTFFLRLALKHISRHSSSMRPNREAGSVLAEGSKPQNQELTPGAVPASIPSALNPLTVTKLCTFSPCIEQVQMTVNALRKYGWIEIETVEMMHKRIDVRRERIGLHEEGLRNAIPMAATVEEAVGKLRDLRERARPPNDSSKELGNGSEVAHHEGEDLDSKKEPERIRESRQERLERIKRAEADRKTFKEGNLVHRTELEIKTHTSYLTFAVLPIEWSDADEQKRKILYQ